eukprot:12326152-Alexandrium_andersonii.AAC.1
MQRASALDLDTDVVAQVAPPLGGVDQLPPQHTDQHRVQAQGHTPRRQRRLFGIPAAHALARRERPLRRRRRDED